MSIKYDLFENPPQSGKEEGWLHARPVVSGTLKTDQLIPVISESSTITGADVKGVLEILSERLVYGLTNSYNVNLEGIGTFSVTLKSRPVKKKKELRSPSVEIKNIEFRPDPVLKKKVRMAELKRVAQRGERKSFTEEERKERILLYIDQHRSIHVTKAMRLNHCIHEKAKKDLTDLVAAGILHLSDYGNIKIYTRNPLASRDL